MNEIQKRDSLEIIEDKTVCYDGYEVVHGEFFAHLNEPSLTFNNFKVYVNAVCIRKVPEFDYIQILVNPDAKKLAIKPCREEEKDSFRWCSESAKRSPREISCKIFFAKVFSLMGWNPQFRYKLLGKFVRSKEEFLFIFDLNTPEVYQRFSEKEVSCLNPVFPEEWKNQFGVPAIEHKHLTQVPVFEEQMIFALVADAEI